jgi:hypothetical protein
MFVHSGPVDLEDLNFFNHNPEFLNKIQNNTAMAVEFDVDHDG